MAKLKQKDRKKIALRKKLRKMEERKRFGTTVRVIWGQWRAA